MCKRLKKIKVAQSDFITYLNIFIQKNRMPQLGPPM